MRLLIDAGNTRVKFGWLQRSTGAREATALALEHSNLGQAAAWLKTLPAKPCSAIGVNVAGATVAARIEQLLATAGLATDWVDGSTAIPNVVNLYDQPSQLGPDRWVAMIGLARHVSHRPAILASFGTATTIDTLTPPQLREDERYAFQGGLIFPGPELMRASLANGTANLPHAQGETVPYPTNTHQAISSGIAAAQAGAVLRQWRAGLARFGQAPQLYCTGGGWHLVEQETRRAYAQMQRDLGLAEQVITRIDTPVLDGLARIAEHAMTASGLTPQR